jgi:hypothetical protein
MKNLRKSSKIPVFQSLKLRISSKDCLNAVDFLQTAIKSRKELFKDRIQVVLILYDLPFIKNDLKAVESARNLKSFTKDLDGYSVLNEKITSQADENYFFPTSLLNVSGLNYCRSGSLYIDNFLYFHSLWRFYNLSDTLLFHVPHDCSEEQLLEVYEKISKHYLNT